MGLWDKCGQRTIASNVREYYSLVKIVKGELI